MGTGIAEGENRAENAAKEAVASPLLEDVDLSGAKGILVNISSGQDIELAEVTAIMEYVTSFSDPDAVIIFGTTYYPEMEGKIRVTLVATGIGQPEDINLPRVAGFPNQNFANTAQQPQQVAPVVQQPHQPQFMNTMGGYQQPAQFSQQQQVAPKPQQVDSAQVFSPSSIPGFMRNGQ